MHGFDFICTLLTSNAENKDLIKVTKDNLSNEIGDLLVYEIGDTLKNPTSQQAKVLYKWAKAFIGLQILNFDPTLKEFQKTTFSQKTFIIDTDILLNCIVKDS